MYVLLCCCIILAIVSPPWIQALPTNLPTTEIPIPGTIELSQKCPTNEFFNAEGKYCELTCAYPLPRDSCNETKVPACECNKGYVRNITGECVSLIKCIDNIPFDVEYNLPDSTSHRAIIHEFTPIVDEIKTTSEPNNTVPITYDVDTLENSDEGSPEEFGPFDPSANDQAEKFISNILALFHPQLINELSDFHSRIYSMNQIADQPKYPDIINHLKKIVQTYDQPKGSYEDNYNDENYFL